MAEVTLIDYGVGNIKAFAHIYERLNIDVAVANTVSQINSAKRLVLPGVGAFDWAMTKLNQSGMRDAIDQQVLIKKIPVLGVCVGMQMMAKRSDEGHEPGLGWLEANVAKFDPKSNQFTPLPHMGWNEVQPVNSNTVFRGIAAPRYYFLHSYVVETHEQADVLATATYGTTFVCAVQKGNVCGTQFHPEKSHQWGINLLQNFAVQ